MRFGFVVPKLTQSATQLVTLGALLVFPQLLKAQLTTAEEKGLPPNSVFHLGNIDAVNLENGNLHISIPIASSKQRGGMELDWTLVYDSPSWLKQWVPNFCSQDIPHNIIIFDNPSKNPPPQLPCPPAGSYSVSATSTQTTNWRFTNPFQWNASGTLHTGNCPIPVYFPVLDDPDAAYNEYFLYNYWTNWQFTDYQGTSHPLALRTEQDNDGGLSQTNLQCLGSTNQSPTLDGSGLYLTLGSGHYDSIGSVGYTKDGVQMLQTNSLIRDANGNIVSQTADTLNRNDVVVSYDPNYPVPISAGSPTHQIYTVHDSNGNPQNYLVDFEPVQFTSSACSQNGLDTNYNSFASQQTCNETSVVILELSQITLPDQKKYSFTYNANSAGELASITLPTGAIINYTYTDFYQISYSTAKAQPNNVVGGRAVKTRTVTVDGRTYPWTYNPALYTNTVTDPDGNVATHTFSQIDVVLPNMSYLSSGYYETNVSYADSTGHMLRNVQTDYLAEFDPMEQIAASVQPIRKTTTLDNGLVSKTETDYEKFSFTCNVCQGGVGTATRMNPTEIREFDYGAGSPGPLMRRTDYNYLHTSNPAYASLNIVDKPQSVTVYDGASNMMSQTTYEYDNYSRTNQLMQASGAIQHDPGFGTTYITRGNETAVSRWLNTSSATVTTTNQYDDAGNLLSVIDPMANTTKYGYSDSWANTSCSLSGSQTSAYPTSVTNAKSQTITTQYNSCTGTVASSMDANHNTTSIGYDLLNRPVQVSFPDGGSTSYCYSDDPNGNCASSAISLTTTKALNGGESVVTTTVFDGLGQAKQAQVNSDPGGVTYSDSVTNDRGQLVSSSTPYRTMLDSTYGMTTYTYDGLGRKRVQNNPDTSQVRWSYTGNTTYTTDENQNQWQRTEDALGRLIKVMEPDPITGTADLETDYPSYDALNNLLTVNQLGNQSAGDVLRTRNFTYDSLSRLLTSQNPETGTICYGQWSGSSCGAGYDLDGNLLFKTDARGVTTGYTYDVLNRLTSKSYSGSNPAATAIAAQTQPVNFTYDASSSGTVPNSVGRLVNESTGLQNAPVTKRSILSYDPMGRVRQEQQCAVQAICSSEPYNFQYTYDLSGNLTSSNNGVSNMGIGLRYTYNSADELQTVNSTWDDATHPPLLFGPPAAGAQYSPAGLSTAWLGMPSSAQQPAYMVARTYDNRLRIVSETDATPTTGTVSNGSITVAGIEQMTTSPTQATGLITITGSEGTHQVCVTLLSGQRCNTMFDTGSLIITIDGFQAKATYGPGTNDATLATALMNAFSPSGVPVTGSPVTATASSNVLTLTSLATGTLANYAYTVSNGTVGAGDEDFSAANGSLAGGSTGPVVNDAGTVSVTVDGVNASVPWGVGSTPESIASALWNQLNGSGGLSATLSGTTITLTGSPAAASTAITSVVSDNFGSVPSFSMSTIGMLAIAPGTTIYGYALGYQPNGNLQSANDSVMGSWTYHYDHLNRLTQATANAGTYNGLNIAGSTLGWSYDSFGNRLLQSSTNAGLRSGSLQYSSVAGNNQVIGTGLASNPTVSLQTIQTDLSGNMTGSNGNTTSVFDAEGRLCAINSGTGGYVGYVYDAEGRRVAKGTVNSLSCDTSSNNGFSLTNQYLLDLGGDPISELDGNNAWKHSDVYAGGKLLATYDPTGLHFHFADWLGTNRVQASGTDVVEETCQSLQYGDSLQCSGSGTDATEQHFTGKERDAESGLDYFGARYYASSMGRWMSPDWADKPEAVPYSSLENPQSLNLYGYVLNNPLSKADPDGHAGCPPDCSTGNDVVDFFLGAGNAFASDNLAGAGRVNQTSAGGQLGQTLGDGLAAAQGVGEFILGAGGNVGGLVLDATGVGALVGVPAGVVSTAAMAHGGVTALTATTNLMKDGKSSSSGKAPIGDDGHPMELHHEGQNPEGPVKEMTRTEHRLGDNFKKNHQNTGQKSSKIDRSKFKKFREQYWKDKQSK